MSDVRPQPLDGGYGWVIVFASFMNCIILGGGFVCFPLIYMQVAEHFDVTLAVTGFIQSFSQGAVFFPGKCVLCATQQYGETYISNEYTGALLWARVVGGVLHLL